MHILKHQTDLTEKQKRFVEQKLALSIQKRNESKFCFYSTLLDSFFNILHDNTLAACMLNMVSQDCGRIISIALLDRPDPCLKYICFSLIEPCTHEIPNKQTRSLLFFTVKYIHSFLIPTQSTRLPPRPQLNVKETSPIVFKNLTLKLWKGEEMNKHLPFVSRN